MRIHLKHMAAFTVALLVSAAPARAESYDFTKIGIGWQPNAISSDGSAVAGFDNFSGVLLTGGVLGRFVPELSYATAQGVNNAHQIVGSTSNPTGGQYHGYFMSPPYTVDGAQHLTGASTSLSQPGGGRTYLSGLNDVGQIVGESLDLGAFILSGYTVDGDGALTGGSYTPITIAGADAVHPTGINDAGWITGWLHSTDDGGGLHGFLRDPLGNVTRLDFPGVPVSGNIATYAYGINDFNQVVGSFTTGESIEGSQVTHGFVYSDGVYTQVDYGGGATNPFDYSYADFPRPYPLVPEPTWYFRSTVVTGIANDGTIVGYTVENVQYEGALGSYAFQGTPGLATVPEPGVLALVSLGGLLAVGARTRSRAG